MLNKKELQDTLSDCVDSILSLESPKGAESLVQESLLKILGESSEKEIPLEKIGAEQVWGGFSGRIDVLNKKHGIEAKVIQFPSLGSVTSKALYDIGQISTDYWRLKNAKHLDSGELIILLMGNLVSTFTKPSEILREFHNRMFVDYETALKFGELSDKPREKYRKRQMKAISEMGFNQPYNTKANGKKIVVKNGLALVLIPVEMS